MTGSVQPAIPSAPSSPPLLPIPELDYRWVHAGAQHLDLLPTPITTASTSYKAFSADESRRIEEAWQVLEIKKRRRAIAEWGQTEGEGAPTKVKKDKDKGGEGREGRDTAGSTAPLDIEGSTSIREPTHAHPIEEQLHDDKDEKAKPVKEVLRSGEELADVETKDDKYRDYMLKQQRDYEDLELVVGVPVSEDSLFEVSLPTLSLHPVFWAQTGPRVSVLRGSWFVTDETRPCSWELAEELERAYQEIRPWQPSYKDELATAISIGTAAEEKLKYNLPARFGQGLGIIFDDGEKGRLLSTGTMTYLSRAFWSSMRSKSGGTYVYRGYGAARVASGKDKEGATGRRSASHSRRGSSSSTRSAMAEKDDTLLKRAISRDGSRNGPHAAVIDAFKDIGAGAEEAIGGFKEGLKEIKDDGKNGVAAAQQGHLNAVEEENAPLVEANDDDAPCTDLILVIHGIGQQLATQYESYNFVYAGNQLRQVMRKQSTNPALASIIRDRRVQVNEFALVMNVLPVQWRASLQLDEEKTEEDQRHGMDNSFTMADITINKSIPYVRELTNSVLLDIPLYMSHHRQKMIEAVCIQANKLYRLWLARNPSFENDGGRVHLIGHSLGSALAAHILSNQPTKIPHLSQLPKQVIVQTRDRFLFNTSNLFLCGSPLGIFLHLDQAQLMPRKGRERTMHSPQDEALDRSGKFGCMAIDSLYNVLYFTDPIAYKLNAAVDVRLAAKRPPLAITSVTAPFYSSVTDGFESITRYLPSYLGGGAPEKKPQRPGVIRLPSGMEMSGPNGEERLEGSRGERRFSALNPHGNVDFFLPSAGVSEYLDMITAHASYWTDPSFAAFLLAEIYSTRLDLMRTGMGLASQILPEGVSV